MDETRGKIQEIFKLLESPEKDLVHIQKLDSLSRESRETLRRDYEETASELIKLETQIRLERDNIKAFDEVIVGLADRRRKDLQENLKVIERLQDLLNY